MPKLVRPFLSAALDVLHHQHTEGRSGTLAQFRVYVECNQAASHRIGIQLLTAEKSLVWISRATVWVVSQGLFRGVEATIWVIRWHKPPSEWLRQREWRLTIIQAPTWRVTWSIENLGTHTQMSPRLIESRIHIYIIPCRNASVFLLISTRTVPEAASLNRRLTCWTCLRLIIDYNIIMWDLTPIPLEHTITVQEFPNLPSACWWCNTSSAAEKEGLVHETNAKAWFIIS